MTPAGGARAPRAEAAGSNPLVKTAVVYYTRFGHTAVVARELAELLQADLFQIEEARTYSFAELGRAAFVCHFDIRPMQLDYSGYERLVLCTPIWMNEPACPARTFLRDARLSGVRFAALFSTVSGEIERASETVTGYLARQNVELDITGRVYTANGTEITMATEAGYDKKVVRVRLNGD